MIVLGAGLSVSRKVYNTLEEAVLDHPFAESSNFFWTSGPVNPGEIEEIHAKNYEEFSRRRLQEERQKDEAEFERLKRKLGR